MMRCVIELILYKYSPPRVRELVEFIAYLLVNNLRYIVRRGIYFHRHLIARIKRGEQGEALFL